MQFTTQTAVAEIGKERLVSLTDSTQVLCKIACVKQAYGNWRFLVTPVNGTGLQWVNADKIQWEDK